MEKKDNIEIPSEMKEDICNKIKYYLDKEMDINIGDLKALLFLDFITENIGDFYYNIGVEDAISMMQDRTEELYTLIKNK